MTEPRKLRVFLCHASQDKPVVRELYERLLAEGWIDPWLDEEKLIPGQDWDLEIEKAIEVSDVVLICLSNSSVSKEGYIQRELKFSIDVALEKPEGAIFIVPLRLDNCQVPRRLRSLQYVDYFPANRQNIVFSRLLASFDLRAQKLGLRLGAKSSNSHDFIHVEEEAPISSALIEYNYGDENFDVSYSVDSKSGEFLGEYGIGFEKTANSGGVQKIVAFQMWLFDKNDIKTSFKYYVNSYVMGNLDMLNNLRKHGEVVEAEKQKKIVLETETLVAEITVIDMQFAKNKITNVMFFNRFVAKFNVWSK